MKLFKIEDTSTLLLFLFKEYSYSSLHGRLTLGGGRVQVQKMSWDETILLFIFLCLDQSIKMNLVSTSCRGGEGNGNPLRYSCLENPMEGGAW